MKNKKILFTLLLTFTISISAQTDSLNYVEIISEMNAKIEILQLDNQRLYSHYEVIMKNIHEIENQIQNLKEEFATQNEKAAFMEVNIANNSETISANAIELKSKIDNTNDDVLTQSKILRKKTMWGIIIAIAVLAISAIITLLLHKKGSNQIAELKQQSDKINEEIVNKFSTELSDMQKISTSIGALSAAGASTDSKQDLIMTLADRITFMEMTLYKMDSGIKGHKHLTRSICQMKDNLKASGYELIDMLGKPYSDGMKAVASFEDDDTLAEGTRIITKVIKPQINYNGIMIQNAQITVSQNI